MSKQFVRPLRLFLLTIFLFLSSYSFSDTIWIDVRSIVEHRLDSIEGDPRISHSDIVSEVAVRYPDKATDIRLYCRSGGRAAKAAAALEAVGYRQVSNVGGIDDAREARGLSVK